VSAVLAEATCVVMPVFNEADTVCDVLDAVRIHHVGPVLVVDDGSTDETAACLASREDIDVVRHGTNRGYGSSLIDGFAHALAMGAGGIVTMDCDGQHEPRHIPGFVAALAEADIVSGSRYLPGSVPAGRQPADRAEVNARITAEVNARTGWGITDSFCGFKAYRSDAVRRLALSEPGYAMPMEVWAQAYLLGLRIEELPVDRIYFDHDRSFGEDLDDPERRHDYYLSVWRRCLAQGPRNGVKRG
jgi:glycosyltransferase involved in cell wall biosynthesis